MNAQEKRLNLAGEPDFNVGTLRVSPSACRIFSGQTEVRVEAQTMAVLVVLARAAGATVTRDQLVEACWQGRIVSDDAITRAIGKVRALAKGVDPAPFTLETVPKVGYRMIAAVAEAGVRAAAEAAAPVGGRRFGWRQMAALAALAIAVPAAWAMLAREAEPDKLEAASAETGLPSAPEVSEALILLDRARVKGYLDRGWNPNWNLDSEGGNALHTLFMACERNPGHNSGMVAVIAQMLVVAGVDTTARNKWDDSPLDIAISPRYCGPNHPVVGYLKNMVPSEEVTRVMTRACGEAFGGLRTKAHWAGSGLTRENCSAVLSTEQAPRAKTKVAG